MKSKSDQDLSVKRFKDGRLSFWVGAYTCYSYRDNSIVWDAGGEDTEEKREKLKSYLKRNKLL